MNIKFEIFLYFILLLYEFLFQFNKGKYNIEIFLFNLLNIRVYNFEV